ncbi:thiol reductant ABC exporter subunit CydC [Acetobacter pasteurianus]|uniref:ATP-binding CydC n=2 Tax=Acetobacter pasteurianus TaxID=438 RepID=C7JB75_ACEP3|nr:thiol reductant ABC exporter subunit CydC [Acetobacter pasteurianus]ASC06729.1 ATP-binding/permease protein CydD [Acetobacter pasteurianus subsp. pasteurianus]BAH99678.1 ATP-binding CydC [Acetobacter pasteurianus IFO 3283-01]BAI02731.1 ATP-binding CydC [Acetobacter pasteurianus IFO 3283-03]BAI05777.1 ATP-binding CydC [Acetobacter pasteurianus IFO 3283-07]BAI08826.1 ATP-binding CydC [Acetobacter pasteurianus IFO 3283-22]
MSTFSRLAVLMKPIQREMLVGLALAVLASLANFGLLFLSGWLLAAAAVAGLGGIVAQNAFNIFLPAVGVRFFATVRILARYLERVVTHDATLRFIGRVRAWSFERLAPQAPAVLAQQRSGDMLFRFVSDTDRMGQFYLQVMLPFAAAAICCTAYVVITGLFSLPAALVLGVGLLLCGTIIPLITAKLSAHATAQISLQQDMMHADLTEILQGMGEFMFLGAAGSVQKHIADQQANLRLCRQKIFLLEGGARCLSTIIGTLSAVAMLALATHAYHAGTLSAACLPMLALGGLAAFDVVGPLPAAWQLLGPVRVAARRVFAVCDQPPCVPAPAAKASPVQPLDLCFCNLGMHYPEAKHWALRHANLLIRQGEHVALVGPSGSGKSTLINLLFRFYDYQEGTASFGNVDLKNVDADVMAHHVGVVAQDYHLFHGSIRRNLMIACPNATEEKMWRALQIAQLAEFVRAEPAGLDTLIGEEGVRLSGGQARRLAIAQVVLRAPAWIILDEPTEGLDTQTEQELMAALLSALPPQATIMCMTHNPAVAGLMDRVVRVEDGRFHEAGRAP